MQEHQVTIGETTYQLRGSFLVLATQNPIEQEGTYPLPEAQLDRFLFKVKVGYPTLAEEKRILNRMSGVDDPDARQKVCDPKQILEARADLLAHLHGREDQGLHPGDRLRDALPGEARAGAAQAADPGRRLARARRSPWRARAGPTRSSAIAASSRPRTSRPIAYDVLRHRVLVTFEAEADGVDSEQIIAQDPRSRSRCREANGVMTAVLPEELLARSPTHRDLDPQDGGRCHVRASTEPASKGRACSSPSIAPTWPGDDIRHIDWKVTARTREPMVKKYEEERELTVILVVDVSASESFGSTAQAQEPRWRPRSPGCCPYAADAYRRQGRGAALWRRGREDHPAAQEGQAA